MKKYLLILMLATFLPTAVIQAGGGGHWHVKSDGVKITFTGKAAEGSFDNLDAHIHFDVDDLASSNIRAEIKVSGITVGGKTQTDHAKGDKWMEADKFPTIKFTSTSITKAGDGYEAKGLLNMHGVEKEVTLPFTFEENGNEGVFKGKLTLMRDDYNIGKAGGKNVAEVAVDIVVPVTR